MGVSLALVQIVAVAQNDDDAPRRGSRVIDDTTKQIYGPRTSRYYFEEDVFLNREIYHQVDTAIRNFHRFNDVQRNDNLYQDLGIIGTSIRPIYYVAPQNIGVSSGFNSLDVYWDREEVKYWDTKSPYTNMYVILGGRGRSITRATYSRNINPRWNFGITYRGIFIDKQIARQGKGDRNTRGHYYDFYTAYQSKDSTYRLFANFRRMSHENAEFGGVRNNIFDPFTYADYFATDAQPWLTGANTRDLRMNIHLFHQYKVGSALQVYHKLDRYRQGNRFTDRPGSGPKFDYVEIDSAVTNDRTKFVTFRNEFGVKGSLAKLFYNGYYAIRDYSMTYQYDTLYQGQSGLNVRKGTESYVGGRVALKLDSLVDVVGWAELLLPRGNYRIEGTIKSEWFDATVRQLQYAPTFLQQYYRASRDFWINDFSNTNATQLEGALHYRSKTFTVSPGATLTRVGNHVFFKRVSPGPRLNFYPKTNVDSTDVMPVQDAGENVIFSPNVKASLTLWKHVHIGGNVIYTRILEETSEKAFQIPELFVNGQISYANIFFNGNFDMHGGIDIHWKSSYYAYAYDIPTQQFYHQGEASLAGFNDLGGQNFGAGADDGRFLTPALPGAKNLPIVDVFLNAKIKRGRVFFKYNNIFQAITGEGYFATPMYPGQRNTFDFGFDWSFYD